MPFGWCPCALFIELSSTSLEARYQKGKSLTHSAVHTSQLLVSLDGCQLKRHEWPN